MTVYRVQWTKRNGRTAVWEYLRRDIAEAVAAALCEGWRCDAHVVEVTR